MSATPDQPLVDTSKGRTISDNRSNLSANEAQKSSTPKHSPLTSTRDYGNNQGLFSAAFTSSDRTQ